MLGYCTAPQLLSMWSCTCAGEMEQPAREPSPQPAPQPAQEFRWAAASENSGTLVKTSLRDIQQQEASAAAAAAASDKGASRTGERCKEQHQALMPVMSLLGAEHAVCLGCVWPATLSPVQCSVPIYIACCSGAQHSSACTRAI